MLIGMMPSVNHTSAEGAVHRACDQPGVGACDGDSYGLAAPPPQGVIQHQGETRASSRGGSRCVTHRHVQQRAVLQQPVTFQIIARHVQAHCIASSSALTGPKQHEETGVRQMHVAHRERTCQVGGAAAS